MKNMFFYGALRDESVLRTILGTKGDLPKLTQAKLVGYAARKARNGQHPVLVKQPDSQIEGILVSEISEDARRRFSFYAGDSGVELHEVTVLVQDQNLPALIFRDSANEPGADWSFTEWQTKHRDVTLESATEIMSLYNAPAKARLQINKQAITTRAMSRMRGRQSRTPQDLQHGFTRDDVSSFSTRPVYAGFFTLDELTIDHKRFDGTDSGPLERMVFTSGDAVTVLPYDPVQDKILLIEQFRLGPFVRSDQYPWLLEAIAGRIDADETPEDVARREAFEEAGLILKSVEKISNYYSSPESTSEYIYSFVGIADLAEHEPGNFGLASESEDIKTSVLPFSAVAQLLQTGVANNGPLIVSLLWLTANRDRLRSNFASA